jgi:long-subunit fatty acid transport protein
MIRKIRYGAGLEYKFTPVHKIDVSYMIQSRFKSPLENDFVIDISNYLTL